MVLSYEGLQINASVLKIDFICIKEYTNLEEAKPPHAEPAAELTSVGLRTGVFI